MAAKKTGSAAPKKAGATASHGTYQEMIKNAIIQLKDRSGSSRQALKKYVLANNNLGGTSDASFTSHFNMALAKGSDAGFFLRPKGASGPVKLGKTGGATKDAPKAKAEPAKKAVAPKKEPAAKKVAAPKKEKAAAAAKPKANTSKTRKAAPKVEKPKAKAGVKKAKASPAKAKAKSAKA